MSDAVSSPARPSVYTPIPAEIVRADPLTAVEIHYEIRPLDDGTLAEGIEPGRFVQVTVPGAGECPISICSDARADGRFEICVRRAGLVTTALSRLHVGDRIGLRGPYGRGFPVGSVRGRNLIIVAGGLGMAPLRSLVQYVQHHRSDFGEVTLVYGTRSPADILFRDEIFSLLHGDQMKVLLTVDVAPAGDWAGVVGPVVIPMRRLRPNAGRTSAFVVGPPIMFKYVLEILQDMEIPDRDIWCSFERRMACGIGKCGQCQLEDLLACKDGPVFSVSELGGREEIL